MALVDVCVDSSALTHPVFAIPEMSNSPALDGSSGVVVALEPGSYHFAQIAGALADFTFTVRADGAVDYDRPGAA